MLEKEKRGPPKEREEEKKGKAPRAAMMKSQVASALQDSIASRGGHGIFLAETNVGQTARDVSSLVTEASLPRVFPGEGVNEGPFHNTFTSR